MKNEYRMSIGQIFHPFSTPFCEVFTSAVFVVMMQKIGMCLTYG